ncbi:MAG: IS1380 family transposase [Actinomycetota bacterium]|nr:IS1380 family transposase [Actinomycetota bacterium]
MSPDSATTPITFATSPLPLAATFDGGRLTSDGGLPWLGEADAALGLCEALAACIPEWRRGPVRHSLLTLVRQRVFQIALGYEDQDDADTLRRDPLLKLLCGRLPQTDSDDLASQPTFSRLENAVDRHGCYRLAEALVETYLCERERDGVPTRLVLDLDGTDDPTHGDQEGTAYHGYYRQHMYHPLLVFDADTGQLVTAILRPGTAHGSRGVLTLLKRLVPMLRRRWPEVAIELRADSGFATPKLYSYCEAEGIGYTIGLASNARLQDLAAPQLAEAQRRHDDATQEKENGGDGANNEKVRLVGEGRYRAESWERERRVVLKTEVLPKGPNVRFVVTSRTAEEPLALYDWYVKRGESEGWVKDLKNACFADRLSCHRFWANQFRLLLHVAAYRLLDTLRRWLARAGAARRQLDTLRLELLKVGGRVYQCANRVRLRLASSHPGQALWELLTARSGRA